MSKITVKLPYGWDNYLVMDSKDFAALADIVSRSQTYSKEYHDGQYYCVAKPLLLEATTDKPEIIDAIAFEEVKNQPKLEAA